MRRVVKTGLPPELVKCMKTDVYGNPEYPKSIEVQREELKGQLKKAAKQAEKRAKAVESKEDDSVYQTESGVWHGWRDPIRFHRHLVEEFVYWMRSTQTRRKMDPGAFLTWFMRLKPGTDDHEVADVCAAESMRQEAANVRPGSYTFMKMIQIYTEYYGMRGMVKGSDKFFDPPLIARVRQNETECERLQKAWMERTRFQNPVLLLVDLFRMSPLYNYMLTERPLEMKAKDVYVDRWKEVYKLMGEWLNMSIGILNSRRSAITTYKAALQTISGLSLKPGDVWDEEELGEIGFRVSQTVQRLLNIRGAQAVAAANKHPHSFQVTDIIHLREELLGYDVKQLKNLTHIPVGKGAEYDRLMCAAVLLVQLLVGSRFVEVLRVSDYYSKYDMLDHDSKMSDTDIVVYKIAKDKRNKVALDVDSSAALDSVSNTLLPFRPVLFSWPPQLIRCLVYSYIRPYVELRVGGKQALDAMTNGALSAKFHSAAISVLESALGPTYMATVAQYNDRARNEYEALTAKKKEKQSEGRRKKFTAMKVGTHLLRKIYANYSYDTLGDKTQTRNSWIQTVLGHAPNSITTSISYTNVVIGEAGSQQNQSAANLSREFLAEVKYLRESMQKFREEAKVVQAVELKNDEEDEVVGLVRVVHLVDKNGIVRSVRGLPYVHGAQREQARDVARRLKEKDIKVTVSALRRFGYGTQIAMEVAREANSM